MVVIAGGLDRVNDELLKYMDGLGLYSKDLLFNKGFLTLNLFKHKLETKAQLYED